MIIPNYPVLCKPGISDSVRFRWKHIQYWSQDLENYLLFWVNSQKNDLEMKKTVEILVEIGYNHVKKIDRSLHRQFMQFHKFD